MKTKIEAIIKELEANACIVNGILEIPLRQVKMTLEKHLQDTEEREVEIKEKGENKMTFTTVFNCSGCGGCIYGGSTTKYCPGCGAKIKWID